MKKEISLQQLLKEGKISLSTLEKVNIAKSYIEKKYSLKKVKDQEQKKDWDLINKKLEELDLPIKEKEKIKQKFIHQEAEYMRKQRQKITIRDFESISIIGRGAFGEVRVCRYKPTGNIVAIKKMRKEDMLSKNQIMHVRTEREILSQSNNPWIVNLRFSFQDDYYLYLVMDFCPGGDLMSLLMKKDILTESEGRFYTAEMVLAVESIHKLNCIHRDLKPDNILIDKNGHIQLSDFGLSKLSDQNFFPLSSKDDKVTIYKPNSTLSDSKLTMKDIMTIKNKRKNRILAFSTVGTPDYIAPEVFGQQGYGQEVDWWSIGVMLFEMLVGYPPFFSENPSETCQKIVKWRQYFTIPLDTNLSIEAENLIRKLVTSADQRLGMNGAEEIKRHPFFKGIDWNNIRNSKAPFIPEIKNDWDTKYFDTFPEQEPFYPPEIKKRKRKDVNYAGYTFNRDNENQKDGFFQALEVLDVVKLSMENKKSKSKNEIIDDDRPSTSNDKTIIEKNLNINKTQSKTNNQNEEQPMHQFNKIPINSHQKKSKSPENTFFTAKLSLINHNNHQKEKANIIPLNGHKEKNGFDRVKTERLSPKFKDLKIGNTNLSPKAKLIPKKSNAANETMKPGIKIMTGFLSGKSLSPKLISSKLVKKK